MKLLDYTLNSKNKRKLTFLKQFDVGHGQSQFHDFPKEPEFIRDTITDTQGLDRAYDNTNYYIHGDTLYIAGTNSWRDVFDDITKVPFYGDLRQSERYQQAEKVLKENKQITRLIGHSLGGSVALQLEKDYDQVQFTRTYGAPVLDMTEHEMDPKVERYRNLLDPISVFDNAANISIDFNPFDSYSLMHSYSNIADNFTSTEEQPVVSDNKEITVPVNV